MLSGLEGVQEVYMLVARDLDIMFKLRLNAISSRQTSNTQCSSFLYSVTNAERYSKVVSFYLLALSHQEQKLEYSL